MVQKVDKDFEKKIKESIKEREESSNRESRCSEGENSQESVQGNTAST